MSIHICSVDKCDNIGEFQCKKCKANVYCSKECQRSDWGTHKTECHWNANVNDMIDYETDLINRYVKLNPYPSYERIVKHLKTNNYFQELSEYDRINHKYCKKIYENPTDGTIIKKMGELINTRGGVVAMRANYYIMDSIFCSSNNRGIKGAIATILLYNSRQKC
jgi:hypothetical protein